MAVIAGGIAGGAYLCDELTLFDLLPLVGDHDAAMCVEGAVVVGMLDDDIIAVAAGVPACCNDRSALGCIDLRAVGCGNVDALMVAVADITIR